MNWLVYIAVVYLFSSAVTVAEDKNEDEDLVDPFYMGRKFDAVLEDWVDPFDLKDYRSRQHTSLRSSIENTKEPIPRGGKNEDMKEEVVDPKKSAEKTEEREIVVKESKEPLEKGEEAKTETKHVGELDNSRKEVICHCTGNEMEHNFLQRFINMLVNKCTHSNAEVLQKIAVILEITPEEVKELHRLRETKDTAPMIRLLNSIISGMKVNSYREQHFSYVQLISNLIPSREVWLDIGVISFAILPLFLFMLGGRITRILCITSLMTFSVSYYGTYRLMLLKAKEKNERILSKTVACTPDEQSWYRTIFESNSDSECQKRWDAMHIDPSAEVTPVKVISHMLAVATFQPLEQFGIMFSQFSSHIFESQSFLYGMIIFATGVMIILVVIALCCSGIFGRGRSFESHHLPHMFKDQSSYESDAAIGFSANRKQMFSAGARNQVPSVSYQAHPHQPVYIITNYSGNIPKNTMAENGRAEHQLPEKEESTISKTKSRKFHKTLLKNGGSTEPTCGVKDDQSDTAETTDDETEP